MKSRIASLAMAVITFPASALHAAPRVAAADDFVAVTLEPFGVVEWGDTYAWGHDLPTAVATGANWKALDAGGSHCLLIDSEGALFAWGENTYGAMGTEEFSGNKWPLRLGNDVGWESVSAGGNLSSAIRTDGSLWTWGAALPGTNPPSQSSIPERIGTGSDWASVATGAFHRLALRDDHSLWAWGYNSHGSIGDGSYVSRTEPVRVGTANDWASVACGYYTSYAIKTNGTLWVWGILSGTGVANPGASNVPVQLGNASDWQAIYPSTSAEYTIAIKQDGTLWSWGTNYGGVLGSGSYASALVPTQVGTATNWTSASAGEQHVVATRSDGSIWHWGYLPTPQLPLSAVPVDCSSMYVPKAEMTVLGQDVEDFPSEGGTWQFPPTIVGEPSANHLIISNDGLLPLQISQITMPTGFSLDSGPSVIPAMGFANYYFRLSATSKGQHTGQAHILSNHASVPDFTLNLSGVAVLATDDSDGDGLNDGAEVTMASLGFNWNLAQAELAATFLTQTHHAGWFSEAEVVDVEIKTSSLVVDPTAQTARLQLGVIGSADGAPLPLTMNPQPTHDGRGVRAEISTPEGGRVVRLRHGAGN